MPTSVTKNAEKVTLQDGSVVEIKPLNIKNLRKFMEITKKFDGVTSEEDGLELLIEAAQVALMAFDQEKYADKEHLEEVLDVSVIADIMRIAGGVDINAENPQIARA